MLKTSILLACLLAPSTWMIATIPPLWRDFDAYNQITRDPLISTFWGWGAAYGYFSKAPIVVIEQLARLGGAQPSAPVPGAVVALSDSKIAALIIVQHLALGFAALGFIRAASRFFVVRLVLALVWASNALLYTFAHCVGSETLSMILIIFLATRGLRLIQGEREIPWWEWYLFAVALWLCLLSRQINGLLIFLVPSAFWLVWIQRRRFFGASASQKSRALAGRNLRHGIIAMAIGIAAVFVAGRLPERLAEKTKLHPHSRMGFTFLWRLQFLDKLTPSKRDELLRERSDRTRSAEARQMIDLLAQTQSEGTFVPGTFQYRAAPLLFPNVTMVPWEKVDLAFNQMAFAFLLPPAPELLQAAGSDFDLARKMPITEINDHIFAMTTYFFQHQDAMPACVGLTTFRDYDRETLTRMPREYPYFHLWRGLNYNRAAVVWLISLLLFAAVGRWRKISVSSIIATGVSLAAMGTLMFAMTCLLSEWIPRYALPMWEFLLLSLCLFLGQTGDLLWSRHPTALPMPPPPGGALDTAVP